MGELDTSNTALAESALCPAGKPIAHESVQAKTPSRVPYLMALTGSDEGRNRTGVVAAFNRLVSSKALLMQDEIRLVAPLYRRDATPDQRVAALYEAESFIQNVADRF